MGADPRDGLATAEWQHARTNPGRPVRQFWDPKHVVSAELRSSNPNSTSNETGLLRSKRFYWTKRFCSSGTRWKDVPTSVFWNGPVVKVIPSLEGKLLELLDDIRALDLGPAEDREPLVVLSHRSGCGIFGPLPNGVPKFKQRSVD